MNRRQRIIGRLAAPAALIGVVLVLLGDSWARLDGAGYLGYSSARGFEAARAGSGMPWIMFVVGMAMVVASVVMTTVVIRCWHRSRRYGPGRCQHCGYTAEGWASDRCPECGTVGDVTGGVASKA